MDRWQRRLGVTGRLIMATRRPLGSGIEAIALLIVSVTITAAIAAAMLVDTLIAPGLSASVALDCRATIHPVVSADRRSTIGAHVVMVGPAT
jgi:hypothetical protein